jgi:hypothetical protein
MLTYFIQNNEPAKISGAGFAGDEARGGALVSRFQKRKNKRVAQRIDDDDVPYLRMAKMAYKTDRSDVGDFKYEETISNKGLAVYEDENNSIICIAYRGTKEMEDIKSDLHVLIDRLRQSDRFKRDYKITDHLIEYNRDSRFILTGHSLGGSIALELHKMYPETKCVVFNPGIGLNYNRHDGDTKFYSMKKDIVSALGSGKFRDSVLIDKDHSTMIDAHRLDSFE